MFAYAIAAASTQPLQFPPWVFKTVAAAKIAVFSTILLFSACIVLSLTLPSRSWTSIAADDRIARFDIAKRDLITTLTMGTPPRLARLQISGTECGIVIWTRSAGDTVSWVSPGSEEYGYGADIVIIGGLRVVIPIRFVRDANVDETLLRIDGRIGLCPVLMEALGISNIAYHSRCYGLTVGGPSPWPNADCASPFGQRIKTPHTQQHHHPSIDPWSFSTCVRATTDDDDNIREFLATVDVIDMTVPRATHGWGLGSRGSVPWKGWDVMRLCPTNYFGTNHSHKEEDCSVALLPAGVPRTDESPATISGEDCSRVAASVTRSLTHGDYAKTYVCVDCARGKNATIIMIFIVTVIGIAWISMTTTGSRNVIKRRAVAIAANVVALCFFLSAFIGSDASVVIEASSGIPWWIVESFFHSAVVGPILARATVALIRAVVYCVKDDDHVSETTVPTTFERATVEIPLFCALWYALNAQQNYLARMAITVGTAIVATISATTLATSSALSGEVGWPAMSAIAGMVNAATFAFSVFPMMLAFFGDSTAVRVAFCAVYLAIVSLSSLMLASSTARRRRRNN